MKEDEREHHLDDDEEEEVIGNVAKIKYTILVISCYIEEDKL